MSDVWPRKFMPLSLALSSISAHYELDSTDKRTLTKASSVLARLAREPSLAPIDPDRQYPLLVHGSARDQEDQALLKRAHEVLRSDMRTAELSVELARVDRWSEQGEIHGWRWLRAAWIIQGQCVREDLRGNFDYYAAIARGFKESDRDRPLRPKDRPRTTLEDIRRLWT
jgi:hypothetical protein